MVGSAVCRALEAAEIPFFGSTRQDTDLTDRQAVDSLLSSRQYEWLVIAAAKVGGIHANNRYPADFIRQNLIIQSNLIDSAYRHGITRLIFLGSSCIYPRDADQPIHESALLTGALEPTNEPYAIAKIAGIKMCESYNRQFGTDYRSLMPTNLYGPGDNFHHEDAHVIPALMRRFDEAKQAGAREVSVWGTGTPRREFLHVDDLARAVLHVIAMHPSEYWRERDVRCSHLNVGTGTDVSIRDLAELIREIVGLDAPIRFDVDKPDGTPRKLLDVTAINKLGWKASTDLRRGLVGTYDWFRGSARRTERP